MAVPDQFVCPITAEIMTDPVSTVRLSAPGQPRVGLVTLPGWLGVGEPRGCLGGLYAKNVTICST